MYNPIKNKSLAIFCFSLLFSSLSFADTLTKTNNATHNEASKSSWNGTLSGTYNDNYANDYRDDKSVNLSLSVGYHIKPTLDISFSSTVTYQQDQFCTTHSKDYWCMANSYIYLTKRQLYDLGDRFQLNARTRLLLPTSKYSQDDHLYTAAGFYLPLSMDLNDKLDGLSIVFTPSINKYFHKYKTAGNRNLTEYTFSSDFLFVYDWNDKWELVFDSVYSRYKTYKGFYKYPSVQITAELDYQLSSKINIGAGYTNNAQYYNPENGRNPINDLFDDKDPYFYLTSSYSF